MPIVSFTKEQTASTHLATQPFLELASLLQSHRTSKHLRSNQHAAGSQKVSMTELTMWGPQKRALYGNSCLCGREFSTDMTNPEPGFKRQGVQAARSRS